MEFRIPLEEYSDDDEVLSLCDLVTEQEVHKITIRDSNAGSLDQEGFGFDFDFCGCDSTTENVFPADDLFRHGRLLPLQPQICRTESLQYTSSQKSISEYSIPWRNDSLDSLSSLWSTSSSTSSNSRRKNNSGEISRLGNSKSKGNHKPPASGGKMSAVWRILTFGLMKPPPMKLEDMRLRQRKTNTTNTNGAKNVDLRRSVSCNYYKDPKVEEMEAKAVNFKEKCRSVKEHVVVVQKTSKGPKTLARFPSFKSCKTSSNDVVDNGRLQKACKKAASLR